MESSLTFEEIYRCEEEDRLKKEALDTSKCPHKITLIKRDAEYCYRCGLQLETILSDSIEVNLPMLGSSSSYNISKNADCKNIFGDLEGKGFSENVIVEANNIYSQISNGQVFRGTPRKAMIFACVFHAYKIIGEPQPHDKLLKIFNITKKTGLKGMKTVNLHAPTTSHVHDTHISPCYMISEIMKKFNCSSEQIEEARSIFSLIKNKSVEINRARPQSIASGVIYYWICNNGKKITLKDFAFKSELSELTILKIYREIVKIYNNIAINKQMYLNTPIHYLQDSDFNSKGMLCNEKIPKDKPVLIMLQANFCSWCTKAKPDFQKFAEKYKDQVFCATIQGDGEEEGEEKLKDRIETIFPNFSGYPDYYLFYDGKRMKKEITGRSVAHLEKFVYED